MPITNVTRATSFFADHDELNVYDQGDVLFVRVTLTNSGTTEGVTLMDYATGLTLVNGSLNVTPIANHDSYTAIGNTLVEIGEVTSQTGPQSSYINGSVLANDSDAVSGPAAGEFNDFYISKVGDANASTAVDTKVTITTVNGGTVTMVVSGPNAGAFTYISKAGFTGTDTFTYTVKDNGSDNTADNLTDGNTANDDDLSSTATVTMTVVGQVWYVDNSASGTGANGTSTNPFTTLTAAESASGEGDTVYIFAGNGTSSGLSGGAGGYTMDANERLVGQHSGLTLDPDGAGATYGTFSLHAASAGARPILTSTVVADVITLASGATVDGVTVDAVNGGGGIFGGTGVSSVTISNVNITDTGTNAAGTQAALELNGTTGTQTISNLVINNTAATGQTSGSVGVLLNNAGTVNFVTASQISITTSGARGLDATGTNMSSSTFDDITVTGSGTGAVSLVNTTGTTNLGDGVGTDLSLTTTSGSTAAFVLNNGSAVTMSAAGTNTVSATGGAAVDVLNTTAITLNFDSVSSTGSTGTGISLNTIGSGTFVADGGTISGAALASFDLHGGSGTVSYAGALGNGAGTNAIEITGRNGGTVTLSGNITDTNDSGGSLLIGGAGANINIGGIVNLTGGTKQFNTGTTTAVDISGSEGMTVNFTGGGLDIDTTSGKGFSALNSGTVTVTGTGNTIASTTGIALDVQNTDIGAGGLVFQSIASNGASTGINLNTTGTIAGLTVTGTGGTTNNNSGGTIANSTGHAINLTSTSHVNLAYMNITDGGGDGIHGISVNNFTINRSNITNVGTDTSDDGIQLGEATGSTVVGVTGAVNITNTVISGASHNGVHIRNTSGNISYLSVSGSEFKNLDDTTGANAFLFEASGTSTITKAYMTGNSFLDNSPQRALEVQAHDTATINDFVVTGNTFINNGIHASFTQDGSANLEFYFVGNGTAAIPMHTSTLQAVNVFSSAGSTGGTIVGSVSGNYIGNGTVANGPAVRIFIQGLTDSTLKVDNNVINAATDFRSISAEYLGPDTVIVGAPSVVNDITITNNQISGSSPSGFPSAAIVVVADNQTASASQAPTVRADIRNNTVPTYSAYEYATGPQIQYNESEFTGPTQGQGIAQLVNTTGAASADLQLDNANTGAPNDGFASPGIELISGPLTLPGPTPGPMMAEEAPPQPQEEAPQPVVDTPVVDTGSGPVAAPAPQTGVVVDDGVVSEAELAMIVEAAIARWADAGATDAQLDAMRAASISVRDLGGLQVGESRGSAIALDDNAAGWSWFIDATPGEDGEYAGSGTRLGASDIYGAAGTRIDLLTVVMHELGHQIGLLDSYNNGEADALMYGSVRAGERRLPGADDAAEGGTAPVAWGGIDASVTIGTIPAHITSYQVTWHSTVDSVGEDRVAGFWTARTEVNWTGATNSMLSNTESGLMDSLTLGNLVFLDKNKDGDFDVSTDTGIGGVTLSLFADNGNNGFDPNADLAVVFTDVNTNGRYDHGIDTPMAAGSTGTNVIQYKVTTSSVSATLGQYSFIGLAPGDYIVRVDASNFQSGGALFQKVSVQGATDPDNNADRDDNGFTYDANNDFITDYIVTEAIRLDYGREAPGFQSISDPNDAGYQAPVPGNDTNNTLDFGFQQPNQPPVIANLDGDSVTYSEGSAPVRIDGGDALATISDPDSPDFQLGRLVLSYEPQEGDRLHIDTSGAVSTSINTDDPAYLDIYVDDGPNGIDDVLIGTAYQSATGFSVSFNGSATPALVQELVRAFMFDTIGENPNTTTRTFTWTLVDGDGRVNGGDDDTTVTSTVAVTALNDAPVGVNDDATIAEDATYTFAASDFRIVSDIEGHGFGGVVITTLPTAGTLRLGTAAVAAGDFVSAEDIAANKLVFTPAQDGNGTPYSTFTFQVSDDGPTGTGHQNTDQSENTFTINVTALNDAPAISNLQDDNVGYTEGSAPQYADAGGNATVSDVDSANFDTGTLTVEVTGNEVAAEDVLYFAESDDYKFDATLIVYQNSVIIASWSGGTAGAPWVFTFRPGATPAHVAAVMRLVTYENINQIDPSTAQRTLTWTLTDGDGGTDIVTSTVTVALANDAPALTEPTDAAIGYTEGANPTPLMQGVVISDVDAPANFAGGSLTIEVAGTEGGINFKPGSKFSVDTGRLIYDDAGTPRDLGAISLIGTTTVAVTGLTAEATPARLNDLVDDFTFYVFGDDPTAGDRTVALTFDDGGNTGDGSLAVQRTQTLTVTAVNDAPVLDLDDTDDSSDTAVAYAENATAVLLAPNAAVSDPDDANIEAASVTISAGRIEGDQLTLNGLTSGNTGTGGAIAFSYDATTGVLTLEGGASKADYQAALRLVGFSSSSDAPGTERTITGTINDGSVSSEARTTTITVAPSEDAPVAVNDTEASTPENASVKVTVLANDSDADGPTPSVAEIDGEAATVGVAIVLDSGATATLNDDGTITYDPNGKFTTLTDSSSGAVNTSATDSFTYKLTGGTATATVQVKVNGVAGPGDRLEGNGDPNTITGTPQGDVFMLQQGGDDTAHGLAGRDIFYFGGEFTADDIVNGGDEFDVIVLQGNYSGGVTLDNSVTNVEGISLQSGAITRWGQTGAATYDYVIATTNAVVAPNTQFRVNGQSLLANEDLTFDGSLETDGGTFLVYGGYGKDDLTGGSGNDIFYFEAGRFADGDTIDGGGGRDAVVISGYGPNPNNPLEVTFAAGSFTSVEALSFNGRFATDLSATPSYDVTLLNGNIAAGETLIVNASSLGSTQTLDFDGSQVADGKLEIYGGAGSDTLRGSGNRDVIYGGAGDDVISPGGGDDNLFGGAGNDRFEFRTPADAALSPVDRIEDFTTGDLIDLALIDANSATGANEAFTFIGAAAFSKTAGELRAVQTAGSMATVSGDVDGDGAADFMIVVVVLDNHVLGTADFIL